MRDPRRIAIFMNRLTEVWMANPDWRFGQLIVNILRAGIETGVHELTINQLFYVEDEAFSRFVEDFVSRMKGE